MQKNTDTTECLSDSDPFDDDSDADETGLNNQCDVSHNVASGSDEFEIFEQRSQTTFSGSKREADNITETTKKRKLSLSLPKKISVLDEFKHFDKSITKLNKSKKITEQIPSKSEIPPTIQGPSTVASNNTSNDNNIDPIRKFSTSLSNNGSNSGEPLMLSEEPLVKVPASINKKLKDYQRDGVKFLYNLYKENKGGILADDMGLGKTIQAIAFICAVLNRGCKEQPNFFFQPKPPPNKHPVLIVAPASVLTQWSREFDKWTRLKIELYHGKGRETYLKSLKSGRLDVLLTSYETFRIDFEPLNGIPWSCMVFDEVHKIKNKQSKIAKAFESISLRRRYGLSGTIIQNSFEELWTLIEFISPNYLGTLQEFRAYFINPIKNGQRHDATFGQVAKGRLCSKRLSEKIKKIVLRRDKTLIKDSLPSKEDHVVFCTMTDNQMEIYKRVLDSPDYQLLRKIGQKCECGSDLLCIECCHKDQIDEKDLKKLVLPAITRIRKIANHPGLLEPVDTKDPEKFTRDMEFEKLALGPDYDMVKNCVKSGQHDLLCGKLRVLKSLLPIFKKKYGKVLLFSSSTKMLDILECFLKKEKFSFNRLDGATSIQMRQKIVDNFNQSPGKFVFLISTKAGGLGLNLVSANVVVIFDANWNQTYDLQAQDRAYRIGQTRSTFVYRLVTAGTIEEVVYNRQIYKQQMANIGLNGQNERRYFTGVQGQKGQEGELFGAKNLLRMVTESVMTDEIIKRAKKAEDEFHMEVLNNLDETNEPENTNGDSSILFDPSDTFEDVEDVTDEQDIDKVLRQAGVVYSHLNTDIIGESEVEKKIFQKASQDISRQLEEETLERMREQESNRLQQEAQSFVRFCQTNQLAMNGMTMQGSSSFHPAVAFRMPQVPGAARFILPQQNVNFSKPTSVVKPSKKQDKPT